MKGKAVSVIFLYSLLFLFYPGDHPLVKKLSQYQNKTKVKGEQRQAFKILYLKNKNLPEISAKALFIVEPKSFVPIYMKNEKTQLYPASTTKIVTALVAREIFKLDQVVEVKRSIEEGRVMGLEKGEKITVENLLYGMLIHSANDAAFALADAAGYKKFIFFMNKKAEELGMKGTHFTNPAGFDDPNHYTTAYDLTLASRKFLQDPFLQKVVGIKEIEVSDYDFKTFHKLVNVNRLLGEVPGVAGLKTGYTPVAGENLISLYKTPYGEILIVLLGSKDRFADTQNLIFWLKTSLSQKEVIF